MKYRWLVPAGFAAAALIVAGCGSSGGSGSAGAPSGSTHTAGAPASGGNTIKTAKIGGATVLTNAKGLTLYWFAPDTSTTSNCNGSCTTFWPPVKGPATLAAGVGGNHMRVMLCQRKRRLPIAGTAIPCKFMLRRQRRQPLEQGRRVTRPCIGISGRVSRKMILELLRCHV